MTVSHRRAPLLVDDVESTLAILRRHGLRASAARRVVLESLFAAEGPISAEALADGLPGRVPRSDLASVYRNLEVLEQLGIVRHVHLGHGPGLYTLAGTAEEYLVCESCHVVRTVAPSTLAGVRDAVREASGYQAGFDHFPIVGLCPGCAARRSHGE
jgi:Fur family ferric uptake transcriptional regulator